MNMTIFPSLSLMSSRSSNYEGRFFVLHGGELGRTKAPFNG